MPGEGEKVANLFIQSFRAGALDDGADLSIVCRTGGGVGSPAGGFSTQGFCRNYLQCIPCYPYYHTNPYTGAAWD